MSVIRFLRALPGRLHREDRGQILFMFIGITILFFAVAVLAIDVSLWHSERRTAQKDADASALAGGQELLRRTTAVDIASRAMAQADAWVTRNGIDSSYFKNSTPNVAGDTQTGCFGAPAFDGLPDSLSVDLGNKGKTLFSGVWNITTGADVGAHAKVCVGSPPDAEGVLPFGIQINPPVNTTSCFTGPATSRVPNFGLECAVEVRPAQASSAETGVLKLYNDGSTNCSDQNIGSTNQTLEDNVANGANTTCEVAPTGVPANQCPMRATYADVGVGKCVWSDTGNAAGTVLAGLQRRLAKEGQTSAPYNCDNLYPDTWFNSNNINPAGRPNNGPPNYNGDREDQWWEALSLVSGDIHSLLPGPTVTFEKRACTSPRVVTIILVDHFDPQGNPPQPILGFAAFWLNGCHDTSGTFNSRCVDSNCRIPNPTGNGQIPCPNPKNEPLLSNNGQIMMDGMFINYVDVGKRGGPLNQFGRIQLFLVE